jgi:hypothetical protein
MAAGFRRAGNCRSPHAQTARSFDDEVRAELGDKFPKHIFHSIICIGALLAHRDKCGAMDCGRARGTACRGGPCLAQFFVRQ